MFKYRIKMEMCTGETWYFRVSVCACVCLTFSFDIIHMQFQELIQRALLYPLPGSSQWQCFEKLECISQLGYRDWYIIFLSPQGIFILLFSNHIHFWPGNHLSVLHFYNLVNISRMVFQWNITFWDWMFSFGIIHAHE